MEDLSHLSNQRFYKGTFIITRNIAEFEKQDSTFPKFYEYMILRAETLVGNQYKLLNIIRPLTHNSVTVG